MRAIASDALVARVVPYGESDVIVTLITETDGKMGAMVRGGRNRSRRVGGALEPFHTIHVAMDDRGGELATLKEARLVRVRGQLVGRLDTVEAAGMAMRWARHLFPPRTPEPQGWRALTAFLDALDALGVQAASTGRTERPEPVAAPAPVSRELVRLALALLAAVGYGLELDGCVVCGRPCPPDRPAAVDPHRGGIVCQACGGGPGLLSASERGLALALQRGENPDVTLDELEPLLALTESAMALHTDLTG